jgi:hypothetical protein
MSLVQPIGLLTDAYEDGFLSWNSRLGADRWQLQVLWPSIYLPNRNKYSTPSQAADYIDQSSSIRDPRIGFSLADLPASLSIVWVAVRLSDVVSNNRTFSSVKTCSCTWITPNSIDTRELVLGACHFL